MTYLQFTNLIFPHCKATGEQIRSKSRIQHISDSRKVAIWYCFNYLAWTEDKVKEEFSMTRASLLYAMKIAEQRWLNEMMENLPGELPLANQWVRLSKYRSKVLRGRTIKEIKTINYNGLDYIMWVKARVGGFQNEKVGLAA